MPLADYIAETIELLHNPPSSGEILVERVLGRRFAERDGNYDQLYAEWNGYAAKRAEERAAKGHSVSAPTIERVINTSKRAGDGVLAIYRRERFRYQDGDVCLI